MYRRIADILNVCPFTWCADMFFYRYMQERIVTKKITWQANNEVRIPRVVWAHAGFCPSPYLSFLPLFSSAIPSAAISDSIPLPRLPRIKTTGFVGSAGSVGCGWLHVCCVSLATPCLSLCTLWNSSQLVVRFLTCGTVLTTEIRWWPFLSESKGAPVMRGK